MNNVSTLSGQLNSSYVKSGDMRGKIKANSEAIAEVGGRTGAAALDLYLTSSPSAGLAVPFLGAIQIVFGLGESIYSIIDANGGTIDKTTTLKSTGDVISGIGILSGCMPATIAGVAMTSIGTLLSLKN